jgi:hypothetical protein
MKNDTTIPHDEDYELDLLQADVEEELFGGC